MSAFVWTNSTNDALFLEFFDISIDITPVNANRISHFLSCDLRIILNQSYYFLLRFLLRFLCSFLCSFLWCHLRVAVRLHALIT